MQIALAAYPIRRHRPLNQSNVESNTLEWCKEADDLHTRHKPKSPNFADENQEVLQNCSRYSMSFVYVPKLRPKKKEEHKDRKHSEEHSQKEARAFRRAQRSPHTTHGRQRRD
jgi:hypothetical protein